MEKENKKTFHLVITDNETGETLHDLEINAAIIGFTGEIETGGLVLARCDGTDYAHALAQAELAADSAYGEHPELRPLATYYKVLQTTQNEETENN